MKNLMIAPRTYWMREAHDKDGNFLWRDDGPNVVFDAAISDILEVYFRDGTKKPQWFIGLINSPGQLLASDTMASHPGWTENVNYNNSTRRAAQFSPVSGKQITTVANKAVFTMTGVGGNIYGTFLASDSTKGGNVGILYAAAPFATGAKNLAATDVLTISCVVTGA
jgi:hypothetical protein